MAGDVTNDPALVANLVALFQRVPSRELIRNLDARMEAVTVNQTDFPLTISDPPNCYICCPSAGYVDYALEETRHFTANPLLRALLTGLIRSCSPLVRATGLDHQVQPNNWLFSTNPVPPLSTDTAIALRDTLTMAHPTRAIVLRSLNSTADVTTIAALRQAGFQMLPARQIYLVDPATRKPPSADMKRDAKLLAHSDYQQVDASTFSADDWARAAVLYRMLYVDKYTDLNPQYTSGFLTRAHQIGLLRIIGLKGPDGALDGVLGMFVNGQMMTVPLIGYDTRKPQKVGLYRMLNAIAQDYAAQEGLFYNLSAGAAGFKRHRNATATIEYTAVYVAHLGKRARSATHALRWLLTHVGVPVMQRFQL